MVTGESQILIEIQLLYVWKIVTPKWPKLILIYIVFRSWEIRWKFLGTGFLNFRSKAALFCGSRTSKRQFRWKRKFYFDIHNPNGFQTIWKWSGNIFITTEWFLFAWGSECISSEKFSFSFIWLRKWWTNCIQTTQYAIWFCYHSVSTFMTISGTFIIYFQGIFIGVTFIIERWAMLNLWSLSISLSFRWLRNK